MRSAYISPEWEKKLAQMGDTNDYSGSIGDCDCGNPYQSANCTYHCEVLSGLKNNVNAMYGIHGNEAEVKKVWNANLPFTREAKASLYVTDAL